MNWPALAMTAVAAFFAGAWINALFREKERMPVPEDEDKTHRLFREAARQITPGPVVLGDQPRIKWSMGAYGASIGKVNGKQLFYVSWGHNQPTDGYVLTSELPVAQYKGEQTKEDAQRMAERILTSFVETIGARWPAHPGQDDGSAPVTVETPTETQARLLDETVEDWDPDEHHAE